jgi:DNA-binding winged helix-turn-helix (wHTH) protein/tetratricopeptide (TPR) repeat protein
MTAEEVFKIGDGTLDLKQGTLRVSGDLIHLRPKTFSLLSHLVRNSGRVVTKDEIFEVVWPGVIVTEDSLTQCVRDARKAIRDELAEILKTVPRRGYILVEGGASARNDLEDGMSEPIPANRLAEPVVAVLPFVVEGAIGEGILPLQSFNEELADAISRFRSLAVIASASARKFAFVDDIVGAGLALKADYCVSGSISNGKEIAVRVDLVEVSSGRRIWTDSIASSVAHLLEAPALLATRIVGRLVGTVEADAARRAQRTPTASLQAYAHMIKGIALLRQHGEGFNEAGKAELETAFRLDGESGLILSYLALAEAMIARGRLDSAPSLRAARERAVRATALAPEEARCHRVLAIVLTYMREFAAAESQYNRAIQLNPYDADTLAQLGFMRAMRGSPLEALDLMDRAVQLNPFHPDWYHADRYAPLFMIGRYTEAAESMERLPHLTARQSAYVAASYAMDGHQEKAAKHLGEALVKDPDLDIGSVGAQMEWERPWHREMLADGLRRASAMWADVGTREED